MMNIIDFFWDPNKQNKIKCQAKGNNTFTMKLTEDNYMLKNGYTKQFMCTPVGRFIYTSLVYIINKPFLSASFVRFRV
jgi:hypothetical protein